MIRIVKTCDRCGKVKQINPTSMGMVLSIAATTGDMFSIIRKTDGDSEPTIVNLCETCEKKFDDWLTNKY